jgi:hypothetical protein
MRRTTMEASQRLVDYETVIMSVQVHVKPCYDDKDYSTTFYDYSTARSCCTVSSNLFFALLTFGIGLRKLRILLQAVVVLKTHDFACTVSIIMLQSSYICRPLDWCTQTHQNGKPSEIVQRLSLHEQFFMNRIDPNCRKRELESQVYKGDSGTGCPLPWSPPLKFGSKCPASLDLQCSSTGGQPVHESPL